MGKKNGNAKIASFLLFKTKFKFLSSVLVLWSIIFKTLMKFRCPEASEVIEYIK